MSTETITKVGVTALVTDDLGRVLFGLKGRACSPSLVNKWVTPGGRLNFGESLVDGVKREVFEETGINIQVTGSLPPQELIEDGFHFVFFVFEAKAVYYGGSLRAGDDLREVRWCDEFERANLLKYMAPLTQRILRSGT